MKKYLLIAAILLLGKSIYSQQNAALSFDGAQYVDINNFNQRPDSTFTFEVWVNLDDASGPNQIIYDISFQDDSFNRRGYFKVSVDNSQVLVTLKDGVTDIGGVIQDTSVYSFNQPISSDWTHIAVVVDSDTLRGYLNGQLDSKFPIVPVTTFPWSFSNIVFNYIGAEYVREIFDFGNFLSGDIDEFRFWENSRTSLEIAANYYQVLSGFEEGLYTYYDFEEGDPGVDNFSEGFIYTEYRNYDGTCGGNCPPGSEGIPPLDTFFDDAPLLTTTDGSEFDLFYATFGPGDPVQSDYWTGYSEGVIRAPVSGDYTITATANDGVIVYLDGELIIDNWVLNESASPIRTSVTLEQGTEYLLEVLHFNAIGDGRIRLSWESPTFFDQTITSYVSIDDISGNGRNGTFQNFSFSGSVSNYVNFEGLSPAITDIIPSRVFKGDTILILGSDLGVVTLDLDGFPLAVVEQEDNFMRVKIPENQELIPGIKQIGGSINFSGNSFILISERSTAGFSSSKTVTSYLDGEDAMTAGERVVAADLDNDGDLDLVIASQGLEESPNATSIGWFENLDGRGNYGKVNIIYQSSGVGITDCRLDIYAADINQDNLVDLVISDACANTIRWIPNQGNGIFSSPVIILQQSQFEISDPNILNLRPFEIEVGDFTGDGLHDVIFAVEYYRDSFNPTQLDSGIYILKNSSTGFQPYERISDQVVLNAIFEEESYPNSLQKADFNKDGLLDLFVGTINGLFLFENDGFGSFIKRELYPIDENSSVLSIAVEDLQKDGDLDAVLTIRSGDIFNYTYTLLRLLNESGQFIPQEIEKFGDEFQLEVISDLVDFDGDGDIDILSYAGDAIIFHQDINGAADFSDPVVVDATSAKQVVNIKAEDLDLDGRLDLITLSTFDSKVQWYNNRFGPVSGIFPNESRPGQYVEIKGSSFSPVPSNNIVLFNGEEAQIDAIRSSTNKLFAKVPENALGTQRVDIINANTGISMEIAPINFTVINNIAASSFWNTPLFDIGDNFDFNYLGAELADLDNDGDLDIILLQANYVADEYNILIYELLGEKQYELRETISSEIFSASFFSTLGRPLALNSFDMEGDGFNDIIVSGFVIKNLDGQFNFGAIQSFVDPKEVFRIGTSVYGDINNDGFNDLIVATNASNLFSARMIAFLNDGNGFFSEEIEITVTPNDIYDIELSDIDNDGDLDIFFVEPRLDKIAWFENENGNGKFKPLQKIVDTSIDGVVALKLKDLDGDGDDDIVAGGGLSLSNGQRVEMEIAWFENLNNGLFSQKIGIDTVSNTSFGVTEIDVSDLNGDGANDVVFNTTDFGGAYRYLANENGFEDVKGMVGFGGGINLDLLKGDIDNDGDIDFIVARSRNLVELENIWLDANIITVTGEELIQVPEVDTENKLVNIEVADTVDLTSYNPNIVVSEEAVYQLLNADFSDTVKVLVLSEVDNEKDYDEDFSQVWEIVTTKVPNPPVLDTMQVDQISATLKWSSDIYSGDFSVEVSDNNQFLSDFVSGSSPIEISMASEANVPNLKPGTRYYGRMRAANRYGSFSRYSNRIDFLTLPGIPIINNVTISTITASQARVSWTSPAGEVDNYLFYLQENVDGVFQDQTGFPLDVLASNAIVLGEDFSTALLSPGTQYRAFVMASNETGLSPSSDSVMFTTLPGASDLTIEAPDVQTNQFSLSWESSTGASHYLLDLSDDDFETLLPLYTNLTIRSTDTVLSRLSAGTAYSVRLKSVNSTGISSDNSTLKVITLPGSPQTLPIANSAINEQTFDIDWSTVVGNSVSYEISLTTKDASNIFTLIDGFPIEIAQNSMEVGRDFGSSFLLPGTEYYVQLRAVNSTGFSAYSDTVKVLTRPSVENANLTVSEISNNSFRLVWNPSNGADYYLLSISDDDFETNLTRYNQRKVFATDTVISNMQSGTGLSARISAVNATGNSLTAATVKFVTLPDNPTILPIELPKITTNTAEIDWNVVNGNSITYEIELSISDFAAGGALVEGYPISISPSEIELGRDFNTPILTAGTDYWIRLRARNSTGYSGYSNIEQFSSLPERPLVTLDRERIGQDSVIISWTEVQGSEEYLLDVSLDNFQTFVPGYSRRIILGNNFSITGLTDGEYYFIRLYANNASGLSAASNTAEVLIKPGTPSARGASDITPISFIANWDPVQRAGSYQFELSDREDFSSIVFSANYEEANPTLIANLEEGVQYFYRIRARNDAGFSTYSNTISITTINPDPIAISLTFDDVFDNENDNVVGVLVTGGYGERAATYRWKSIGSDGWSDFIDLTVLSFGQYQFIVQPTMLDAVGMQFEVRVTDELGKELVNGANFVFLSISEDDGITLPLTTFGGNRNSWQIFSIPYELEDNFIESVFAGVASKEYKKEWRLMHYESSGSYVDFGEGLNRIELGKSYWFNAIEEVEISLGSGLANKQVPFSLSLSPGWNQIGNPYNIEVDWNRVLLNNDASGKVGGLVAYEGVNPVRSVILEPFKGGFVFAEESVALNILPSNSTTQGARVDPESYSGLDTQMNEGWLIDLEVLNNNRQVIEKSSFGMNKEASDLKDQYDLMKAPKFISYTELSSKVADYFYSSFEKDIRSEKLVDEWIFRLSSNELNESIYLSWEKGQVLESGKPVFLVDIRSGIVIDMRTIDFIRVSGEENQEFRIFYGLELEEVDFGEMLLVGDVYPNPVSQNFTVPVILPASNAGWNIEYTIYNIQGREVFKQKSHNFQNGYTTMNITLNNSDIQAGVYLLSVRISGEKELVTQQKIIVR